MIHALVATLIGIITVVALDGHRGKQAMETQAVERESVSEVLRATHLAVIRLETVEIGNWVAEAQGPLKSREVRMSVRLEQVLKGETVQQAGRSFPLRVQQRGTGTYRVADDYGLWSKVEPSAGLQLLAFCTGASDDLVDLLTDAHCERLAEAEAALPDVQAALDLEARDLPPQELQAEAVDVLKTHGGILARYVWARLGNAALADESLFAEVMRIVESPTTPAQAREVLLQAAYDDLGMAASPPRPQELRLARAMLVLLTLPEAVGLHANLCEVYLPNLIGLSDGEAGMTADEVLAGVVDLEAKVGSALQQMQESDPDGRLRTWLSRP